MGAFERGPKNFVNKGTRQRISSLPKYQINHPATPDVRPWLATVCKDVGVVATGFFQGVGQDRQAVEGPIFVDRVCNPQDGLIVPAYPTRIERDSTEGIAEDIA